MSQELEKSRDFSRILENWEVSMNGWEVKREMAIPIWQERIKACRASGMGIGFWCAENSINRKTYYRWEKLCIARALQEKEGKTAETYNENALIKIDPMTLSNKESSEVPISTVLAGVTCTNAPFQASAKSITFSQS